MLNKETHGLVSIIIPCYNHGSFLSKAIQSVFEQNYNEIEVIVVDDGSTDNTREVALSYQTVTYLYQENRGLSAARNAGIKVSKGAFLIFLDADDWLLPDAINLNINYLHSDEKLAFVSGGHIKVFDTNKIITEKQEIQNHHFENLLRGNYIGMHAAVMYRRWVFDEFLFDETLSNCEDYDLYLKIARLYPVSHHMHLIAAYRFHHSNMSGNIPAMLKGVLNILERQNKVVKNPIESSALANGKKIWIEYYCRELYKGLLIKKIEFNEKVFETLLNYKPVLLLKYFLKKILDVKTTHSKVSTSL